MRTFGPSAGSSLAAIALGVALVSPSVLSAQRNSRRSARGIAAPRAASAPANRCSEDCDDYSLAIVSALLPIEPSGSAGTEVVTVVIENRGAAPAPVSFISVAPRTHLAAARHTIIPALAPGERATVQLPVATGPDGTQCISITISPAPARDPVAAQALASVAPDRRRAAPVSPAAPTFTRLPEVPFGLMLSTASAAPDGVRYGIAEDASHFDAIRKSDAFGSLDA